MIKGTVIYIVLPAIFRCCMTFMFIYWRYKFRFSFFFSRTELLGAERDANICKMSKVKLEQVGMLFRLAFQRRQKEAYFW